MLWHGRVTVELTLSHVPRRWALAQAKPVDSTWEEMVKNGFVTVSFLVLVSIMESKSQSGPF